MTERYRPEPLSDKKQVVDLASNLIYETFDAIAVIPKAIRNPQIILVSDKDETGWKFEADLEGNKDFKLKVGYLAIGNSNRTVELTKNAVDAEGDSSNEAITLKVVQQFKSPYRSTLSGGVVFTDLNRKATDPYYQPEVNTVEAFQKANELIYAVQTSAQKYDPKSLYH